MKNKKIVCLPLSLSNLRISLISKPSFELLFDLKILESKYFIIYNRGLYYLHKSEKLEVKKSLLTNTFSKVINNIKRCILARISLYYLKKLEPLDDSYKNKRLEYYEETKML